MIMFCASKIVRNDELAQSQDVTDEPLGATAVDVQTNPASDRGRI